MILLLLMQNEEKNLKAKALREENYIFNNVWNIFVAYIVVEILTKLAIFDTYYANYASHRLSPI